LEQKIAEKPSPTSLYTLLHKTALCFSAASFVQVAVKKKKSPNLNLQLTKLPNGSH